MDAPDPGNFWKIPFCWDSECPPPSQRSSLNFTAIGDADLVALVAELMADSLDQSDHAAVSELGAEGAARELLDVDPGYFASVAGWWRLARDRNGTVVGLVLPILLKGEHMTEVDQPQGTIYYMGVLPRYRGRGYARQLLDEATRLFLGRGCRRVVCDADVSNLPMLSAFRACGYHEGQPWQRPLRWRA